MVTKICRSGSNAPLLQFMPPRLPGKARVPVTLGGVKMPSFRNLLSFSLHLAKRFWRHLYPDLKQLKRMERLA